MSEDHRHTILLVDDEPNVLTALCRDLKSIDAELIATTDVHEALHQLKQRSISLIISDEKMPVLSGWQFLSLARQMSPATIRVILTAHTDMEALDMAINRARVAKVFLKPWEPRTFVDSVARILDQYKPDVNSDRTATTDDPAPLSESGEGLSVGNSVSENEDQTR